MAESEFWSGGDDLTNWGRMLRQDPARTLLEAAPVMPSPPVDSAWVDSAWNEPIAAAIPARREALPHSRSLPGPILLLVVVMLVVAAMAIALLTHPLPVNG